MKNTIILITLLLTTVCSFAIKVRFTTANMSVNVAEGSIGVFTSFEIYPDNFVQHDSTDFIELIDFPTISYDNLQEVIIEKAMLSADDPSVFEELSSFVVTDSNTVNSFSDFDILQGNTYVYRLAVITNSNQQLNLINKSISTEIAYPIMNCAKLNNIYRKAGHNTYQKSVASSLATSLFLTRVLELDMHIPFLPPVVPNDWFVAHSNNSHIFGNNNNCGSGNKNFSVCLDDLVSWHNVYPNHDPITVFIDIYDWITGTHTPAIFDNLLIQKFGINNIYKPRDLIGNSFGDMRIAAQQNNWPSMGDLTGKFIFVLTGSGSKVSEYIASRSTGAVAFSAAKVESIFDVALLPTIGVGLKNDIVFYNMQQFCSVPFNFGCGSDADFNIGYLTSNLGYINRTYGIGIFGQPGSYSNSEYVHAMNFNMNNIAVGNIANTFYPLENGIQWLLDVTYPGLVNDHIYSDYQNVTQAATQNIVATDLIVEPDAHYRMIAGNSIDLQPGVEFKADSDVDVRIDDCTQADYSLRMANPNPLSQEEIAVLMHELDKGLYGYVPKDEEKIEQLMVYPNPTNKEFTISYRNYLLNKATLNIYDITGRTVKTQTYQTEIKGSQSFSVDLQSLKEGTYFYNLQVGNQTKNGKVIKVK